MEQAPEMHITIVAAGGDSRSLTLTHEIGLVKAALLYADRVTLASPRATLIASVGAIGELSDDQRTEVLLSMASQLQDGADFDAIYRGLKQKRFRSKQELLLMKQIERKLKEAGDALASRTSQMAIEAGLHELLPAVEEGVLDLDPLGAEEGDLDRMVERMSQLITDVVASRSTTLPMFDDQSGGLLRAMMKEGQLPDAHFELSSQAEVAARFITWMPAFPAADLERVLHARGALRAPLVRYRSAVIGITKDLDATPIDDRFDGLVHDLYRRHVEPALLEIEDLSEDLGLRSSFTDSIRSGAGRRVAEAAVGFAAADVAGLPPTLLAGLGVSADLAADVLRRRHDLKKQRSRSQFFYLYAADRALAK